MQRNFLRNPLTARPWICPTCRGVRSPGYPLCLPCQAHRDRAGGLVADLVVPISYSPRDGQHHYNLRTYKGAAPSTQARWNLLALVLLFLHQHLACIADRVGGRPTHLVTVPSTRGRPGEHPLAALLGQRLGLPVIPVTANARYGAEERQLHRDWFTVQWPTGAGPVRVLVIDDTWTTGSRAQSLAYALKRAGAASVAVVVLGRHVNPQHQPSRPLLTATADRIFDPAVCAAEPNRGRPG